MSEGDDTLAMQELLATMNKGETPGVSGIKMKSMVDKNTRREAHRRRREWRREENKGYKA
jgi:hypothetical protein